MNEYSEPDYDTDYLINGPTIHAEERARYGRTLHGIMEAQWNPKRHYPGLSSRPTQIHDVRDRTDPTMSLKDQLQGRIDRLEDRLAMLESFGDDTYNDGTVLKFTKVFPGSTKEYTYAALKVDGIWYTTGPKSENGYTWEQLCLFLAKGKCLSFKRASKWTKIGS